jgi:tRNA(Leu) C34 or U34 (ribose-2'-O)-methylase TrmL
VRVDLVGQSIDFDHPKVVTKLKSWNISDPVKLLSGKSSQYESIDDLKQKNRESRLIGAVVTGGSNPFQYEWEDNDIIVISGANGLSRQDVEQMDDTITVPTVPEVELLTVSTVVSSLTYHILTQRGLWNKLARG